jgi:hypothetical protein
VAPGVKRRSDRPGGSAIAWGGIEGLTRPTPGPDPATPPNARRSPPGPSLRPSARRDRPAGAACFRTLHAARADNSWDAEIRRLLAPDPLILDDFGLKPLTMVQAEDFYEVVAERHLRVSIVLTSNRPPADWLALFPDPVMANSALDRLAHNAHHLVMKGESYRKRSRPKTQTASSNET